MKSDLRPGRVGRSRILVAASALALALALVAGCSDSGGSGGAEKAGAGAGGGQAAPAKVGVITAEPQEVVITAHVAGRVVAFQTAEVRPQVGGLISQKNFKDGSKVAKGDVLYKIDDRSYQAAVDSAVATLQKNQAAAESAKLQYERYQNLTSSNVVSKQDRDDALSTYRQAQADIAAAEAALETAKLNLAYTEVAAPISGRIGTDTVDAGTLVTASQSTALATIRQIDPVYVDFTESSGNLLAFRDQIRRGGVKPLVGAESPGPAEVHVRFADGSAYPEAGTIAAADQFVSETTSSFTVRTRFPNPDAVLLPGMYVRGTVRLAVDEHGFLVPQRAVSRNAKGEATALFVTADGTAETRVIEVSADIGNEWMVTKGVAAGDRLVVDGLQKVRDGAKVAAVPVTVDADGLVQPADGTGKTPADDGANTAKKGATAGNDAADTPAAAAKAGASAEAEAEAGSAAADAPATGGKTADGADDGAGQDSGDGADAATSGAKE
ncbi:efflux RND transporter periplasmic adaptor subunit [Jiella sonneratiae]|uniref:Efflux RND transporter periplasmic adaptor subunit n=1 Tax=Jiella sonneratiae TaxID=2816856 RepID=A0ABS3J926_9HYPH|nr:efflux RND transporter periplasmic adaptor subunit [Jiella sonneratiae]MBO0906180.1 efflux RND transporter periplasmic adaptor subunit [Jiella sonneratiae]